MCIRDSTHTHTHTPNNNNHIHIHHMHCVSAQQPLDLCIGSQICWHSAPGIFPVSALWGCLQQNLYCVPLASLSSLDNIKVGHWPMLPPIKYCWGFFVVFFAGKCTFAELCTHRPAAKNVQFAAAIVHLQIQKQKKKKKKKKKEWRPFCNGKLNFATTTKLSADFAVTSVCS